MSRSLRSMTEQEANSAEHRRIRQVDDGRNVQPGLGYWAAKDRRAQRTPAPQTEGWMAHMVGSFLSRK